MRLIKFCLLLLIALICLFIFIFNVAVNEAQTDIKDVNDRVDNIISELDKKRICSLDVVECDDEVVKLEPNQVFSPPNEVKKEIREQAFAYSIPEQVALDIANCESEFDEYARNPNSSASGVFQFIDLTFSNYCSGDVFNYKDNIKCFMEQFPKHPEWWSQCL